jgi:hypothetical protein
MSLIRYTHPMMHLQQQINRMFDQFDTDLFGRLEGLGEGMFTPPVDIKEDADAYTVHLEVPGVSQDNLHLSLQDNVLTIKVARNKSRKVAKAAIAASSAVMARSRVRFLCRATSMQRESKRIWKMEYSKSVCPSAKNRSRARSTSA